MKFILTPNCELIVDKDIYNFVVYKSTSIYTTRAPSILNGDRTSRDVTLNNGLELSVTNNNILTVRGTITDSYTDYVINNSFIL